MRALLHALKIAVYVSLLTVVLGFALLALTFIIYGLIEWALYNNGKTAPYNWSMLLSISISIYIIWRLYRNKDSFKRFANDDGMLIFNVSSLIVAITLLLFFIWVCIGAVKKYSKRDKDPRINSLEELLDQSSELQGQTITMSPDLYDTAAIYKDVNRLKDNAYFIWQNFSSKTERFSAKFPNYEILRKKEFFLVNADTCSIITYYADKEGKIDCNIEYSIAFIHLPSHSSISVFFEALEQNILNKSGGVLISNEDYNGKGFIGRKIEVEIGRKSRRLSNRIIYYKSRMYIQSVLSDYKNANNDGAIYFFNSLQLH